MASPDRPNYKYSQKDKVPIDLSRFEQMSVLMELPDSNTNTVETVRDKRTNILYVKRTLRQDNLAQLIHRLSEEEFPAVGFVGNVRGRSMQEQAEHMQESSDLGLIVPTPFGADEQILLYTYIPGDTLSKHIKDGNTAAIAPSLTSLAEAHKQDIIHGDPYPGNFILQDDEKIVRIDFDVEIEGKYAKELELSQFLWAVCNQTIDIDPVADMLGRFVQEHPHTEYDWDQISTFMKKYETYLRKFSNGMPRLGEKLVVITSTIAENKF